MSTCLPPLGLLFTSVFRQAAASQSQGMVAVQTLKSSHRVPPGSQQPWKNITQVSSEYHHVIPGGSETVTGTDSNIIVKLQGCIILNVSSQVKHITR